MLHDLGPRMERAFISSTRMSVVRRLTFTSTPVLLAMPRMKVTMKQLSCTYELCEHSSGLNCSTPARSRILSFSFSSRKADSGRILSSRSTCAPSWRRCWRPRSCPAGRRTGSATEPSCSLIA